MRQASFIAGDWGTSYLRLFLCEQDGAVIDRSDGPGAAQCIGKFPETLDSLTQHWRRHRSGLPVYLCGMVGSSFGWMPAPYLSCPARPADIAAACVTLSGGVVHIVPGLACRNPVDAPDVMRGEETQILGLFKLHPLLAHGRHLLCLPGTHTKWVSIDEGMVRDFLTAPTGELFAALCAHTVLVKDDQRLGGVAIDEGAAFDRGVAEVRRFTHVNLLHRLFESRSRRVAGELDAKEAAPFLSGMLIAADVQGALNVFAAAAQARTVFVIGSAALTERYAKALSVAGKEALTLDGSHAAVTGLAFLHQLLSTRDLHHVG